MLTWYKLSIYVFSVTNVVGWFTFLVIPAYSQNLLRCWYSSSSSEKWLQALSIYTIFKFQCELVWKFPEYLFLTLSIQVYSYLSLPVWI